MLVSKAFIIVISGKVPRITAAEFEEVTKDTERTCIFSKAFSFPIAYESHFVA
jgi:organic hydroperoxide reductase OsmC/OhrA